MRREHLRWLGIAFAIVAVLGLVGTCFGEEPYEDSGDPYDIPPGCQPPQPTPSVASPLWTFLMTMAVQLVF